MNNINFNQDGGFYLSTNILNAVQAAYSLFNSLGYIAGDLSIISGCNITGNSVSDGVVFINGEVLPFIGGNIGTNVIIKQNVTSYPFQNGTVKPVLFERAATFGTSTVNYLWADFRRVFQTKNIQEFKDDFEARIKALENRASDVPVGTVIRYDQPLVVLPPTGWIDWNPADEQGRVWTARSESDSDFGLGTKGGSKIKSLTESNLPTINIGWVGQQGTGWPDGSGDSTAAGSGGSYPRVTINKSIGGGATAFSLLQPYVSVRYIKYIGQ